MGHVMKITPRVEHAVFEVVLEGEVFPVLGVHRVWRSIGLGQNNKWFDCLSKHIYRAMPSLGVDINSQGPICSAVFSDRRHQHHAYTKMNRPSDHTAPIIVQPFV